MFQSVNKCLKKKFLETFRVAVFSQNSIIAFLEGDMSEKANVLG